MSVEVIMDYLKTTYGICSREELYALAEERFVDIGIFTGGIENHE